MADYPSFGNVLWTMIVFFAWVIWFWILITILADLFSRHDISGWGKAAWTVFVIILPFLGVLVYLISQGKSMAERRNKQVEAAESAVDDRIRSVATDGGGAAAEIQRAKELLDTGAIDQAEFDKIKRLALA
ncbi:MAG TPA: SHOCT domain-containing protein [Thermoleophilaceae bacterium]|nr:SHOCT domain-containing protein [Thermoleophilaceae bacterium]